MIQKRVRWTLGAALLAASSFPTDAFAQSCAQPEDIVESAMFTYTTGDGFRLDHLSGSPASGQVKVHGWVRDELDNPEQTVFPFFYVYKDNTSASKPALDNPSSFRFVDYDSTDLGGMSFFAFEDVSFSAQEMADGGTARYYGFVLWYDSCDQEYEVRPITSYLSPFAEAVATFPEGNGILSNLDVHSGMIADIEPTPSDNRRTQYLGLGREEFDPTLPLQNPQQDPLDRDSQETAAYYASVSVDPSRTVQQARDQKAQCIAAANQLCQSCRGCSTCVQQQRACQARTDGSIATDLPTLQAFRDRYFSTGKEIVTEYFNDGDLGIGRKMHCNFELPGQRACYVFNYAPCREGEFEANGRCRAPVFGDRAGSIAAQVNRDVPFAAVAMVERDQLRGQPNETFFAVFACTGANCADDNQHTLFSGPVALDNHGVDAVLDRSSTPTSNTFNPGNCMTCHGGGGEYSPATVIGQNADGSPRFAPDASTKGAAFLPFDMDVFDYFTGHTRRDNMAPMREMNRHIAEEGMLRDMGVATQIVQAWYGGENFDEDFFGSNVPAEFDPTNPPVSSLGASIYRDTYGKGCRGCHITQPDLQLATRAQWEVLAPTLKSYVCDLHRMPMAERTQDVIWDEYFRQRLVQNFGILDAECSP